MMNLKADPQGGGGWGVGGIDGGLLASKEGWP